MFLVPLSVILLLAVGISLGHENLCSPQEDISPCTCKVAGRSIVIECTKVNDAVNVRSALQSVKAIRWVEVRFFECSFGLLPSDLFDGLHVTKLSFSNCTLQGIGNEGRSALEGLEDTIETFVMKSSFHKGNELRFPNVSKLHKLRSIELERNDMDAVENGWFAEGPTGLKFLSLPWNKLERIGDRAFAQLKDLVRLGVYQNKVTSLERSMFPSPAARLERLDLRGNKISSLPVDMFSNMPALEWVYLAENSLQHIPEATWKTVWSQLNVLYLEDNPLLCDSSIEWTFKERRPAYLTGTCYSSEKRKKLVLHRVIDDHQKER